MRRFDSISITEPRKLSTVIFHACKLLIKLRIILERFGQVLNFAWELLRAAQRGYESESGFVTVGAVWVVGVPLSVIGRADRRAVWGKAQDEQY